MQTSNYITTGGRVYIAALNDDHVTKHIKGKDGYIALHIPKKWNEWDEDYVKQDGIVVAAPNVLVVKDEDGKKKEQPVQVKPGDRIFTHHHLCHDDNNTGGQGVKGELDGIPVWQLEYDQCYCVVSPEGEVLKVLGQWVLLEPIPEKWETETGVLKTYRVNDKENYAVVRHMSDRAKEELDMKEGDTVFIHKRGTYRFKIDGTTYFRTRIKDIYAVVENAEK